SLPVRLSPRLNNPHSAFRNLLTAPCLLLLPRGLRRAYEAARLVAERLLKVFGPVGLVGVEPLEVFEDAGVAARELLYERRPARGQPLRPLARRVNALGDGRVNVGEQTRPLALPALQHFRRAASREVFELFLRV